MAAGRWHIYGFYGFIQLLHSNIPIFILLSHPLPIDYLFISS